jgi:hypothetical protein
VTFAQLCDQPFFHESFEFYQVSFSGVFPSGYFKKWGTELKILPEYPYQIWPMATICNLKMTALGAHL